MRMQNSQKDYYFIASLFVFSFLFGFFSYYLRFPFDYSAQTATVYNSLNQSNPESQPAIVLKNPFEMVDIKADAAIVFAPSENKIFYQKNALKQLPLASITKLATAAVALESLQEDELIPFAGDLFKTKDLLGYMLTVSSNEAAQAVKDYLQQKGISFEEKTKQLIAKANLKQSYFLNPSGLDESDYQAGAYGSAYDVGKLIYYLYLTHPEVLEYTAYPQISIQGENGLTLEGKNTNKSLSKLPGFIGGKTGYTDLAGGNLAVLLEPGGSGPYVIVVLSSTKQERFKDVEKLTQTLLENLEIIK